MTSGGALESRIKIEAVETARMPIPITAQGVARCWEIGLGVALADAIPEGMAAILWR